MTRQDIRDALNDGVMPVCRLCGLLSERGCPHTADYREPDERCIAPAHLFYPLAPRAPTPLLSLRISSQTGLPLPDQLPSLLT